MLKIKVTIQTEESYPCWLVKDYPIEVDETKENHYWAFEDLRNKFQSPKSEYPIEMLIERL